MSKRISNFKRIFVVLLAVAALTSFTSLRAGVVIGTIGNGTYVDYNNNSSQAYGIDFNNDGTLEFSLTNGFITSNFDAQCPYCTIIFVGGDNGNNVWAAGTVDSGWDLVQLLSANTSIGANGNWIAQGDAYLINNMDNDMPLLSLNIDSYLGFRFLFNGSMYYGWAKVRMTTNSSGGYDAQWLECAYDNTGVAILAANTGVGIAENNNANFNVFPVPATDFVTIEAEQDINMNQFSAFDFSGRLVNMPATILDNRMILDLSNLKSGIYFIRWNDLKAPEMVKIVKQ
ncbi:MAG TPA: T9SS type A sorting domain-containing protein [Bacteroidales bacterium]|nr:T9SS type A sorting domain-containing protein [Bacteroidales bacterium]